VLTGDFNQFIKYLGDALIYRYKPKAELLIHGDINTDYCIESNWKKQLVLLLTTHNLSQKANFATRIQNYSITATDNIFVDSKSCLENPL
jgi:hypothetical protein